jgi:tRNA threonylcarbamoyladenosine biosynthesis protein TsaE
MDTVTLHFHCRDEAETQSVGEALGRLAWPGFTLRLSGDLGAGKTVFARGFARGLDIGEAITSPSYPIIQDYQGRLPLYHMDWYRLSSADEVLDTGAGELLDGGAVCLVEWPDRAGELFGRSSLALDIAITAGGERCLALCGAAEVFHARLDWPRNLPEALSRLLETPSP